MQRDAKHCLVVFGRFHKKDNGGLMIVSFHACVTHLAKKARNALLNMAVRMLVIFGYLITLMHIWEYCDKTGNHGLRKKVYDVLDKQDSDAAFLLLCQENLPEKLVAVVGKKALGTAMYLRAVGSIINGFRHKKLTLDERVKGLYYGMSFFDQWHAWIEASSEYSLNKNFESAQLYCDLALGVGSFTQDYAMACIQKAPAPQLMSTQPPAAAPEPKFFPITNSNDPEENLHGHVRELVPGKPRCDVVEFFARLKRIFVDCIRRFKRDAFGKLIFYSRSTRNRPPTHDQQACETVGEAEVVSKLTRAARAGEAAIRHDLKDLGMKVLFEDKPTFVINKIGDDPAPSPPEAPPSKDDVRTTIVARLDDVDDHDDDDGHHDVESLLSEARATKNEEDAALIMTTMMGVEEESADVKRRQASIEICGNEQQDGAVAVAVAEDKGDAMVVDDAGEDDGTTTSWVEDVLSHVDEIRAALEMPRDDSRKPKTTSQKAQAVRYHGRWYANVSALFANIQGHQSTPPMDRKTQFWIVNSTYFLPHPQTWPRRRQCRTRR